MGAGPPRAWSSRPFSFREQQEDEILHNMIRKMGDWVAWEVEAGLDPGGVGPPVGVGAGTHMAGSP